jgi:hypothetical protein
MENKGNFLENLQANQWLERNRLQYYAQAVRNRGGAVQNCWGFIDGTARPICASALLVLRQQKKIAQFCLQNFLHVILLKIITLTQNIIHNKVKMRRRDAGNYVDKHCTIT